MIDAALSSRINLAEGIIEAAALTRRYLKDLKDVFADRAACEAEIKQGNPLLYTVSTVDPAKGEGQLGYALGKLMPGKIGREYFMTKGHYHEWRAAAEVYLGIAGQGMMLLEDERGESRLLELKAHAAVYVPGHTAHRTINIGKEPLLYLAIYPSGAGHDYASIAQTNFRKVVVERNGAPVMLDRREFKP